MPQHYAKSHGIAAWIAAQAPADQHSGSTLEKIPHEGKGTAFQAEYAQHVGAAGVAAAMPTHIITMEQMAENDCELHIPQQISQHETNNINFDWLNIHKAIIACSLFYEKATYMSQR
ncbi:hypothetical protein SDC9_189349 [bioreactor metagenome]|uniref:Uncharacterized protein n=1 Tax=bioreactor metagenome TaxID=1076179 RepID=A0A645I051_9ZZZZ